MLCFTPLSDQVRHWLPLTRASALLSDLEQISIHIAKFTCTHAICMFAMSVAELSICMQTEPAQ